MATTHRTLRPDCLAVLLLLLAVWPLSADRHPEVALIVDDEYCARVTGALPALANLFGR